jgi:flagellar basal-body rod protein FlgG
MLRGIYCSNTALNAMQEKMDNIANNLANVNTEGFRQEKIAFKTWIKEIYGISSTEIKKDFSTGNLKETGREYDFAINGDAFFKVNTAQGDRYIKNGSFNADESGYLMDINGNKVAGVSGEVKMVNGKPDQEFFLINIKNKEHINHTNQGFEASDLAEISRITNVEVIQGQLEGSNVDLIYNLTEMINTSKNYSFNSKILMSQDEMLKKAAEEIGSLK